LVKAPSGVNVGPEVTVRTPAVAGLSDEASAATAAAAMSEQRLIFFMILWFVFASLVSFSGECVKYISVPIRPVDARFVWSF